MTAPTLSTPRLILRPHTLADVDDASAMWADPAVTRFIGGRPFTAEESWSRVLRYAGLWSLLGYGYWVIRERISGRFVGEVGLADFRRKITPPLDAPEVGWALASWAHERGFATEAVQTVLGWADTQQFARTVCLIHPDHAASARVAIKCGFHEHVRLMLGDKTVVVYEREQTKPRRG